MILKLQMLSFQTTNMFTGIIEQTGKVKDLTEKDQTATLTVISSGFFDEVKPGDSVAVNGTCLTVVTHDADSATFDLGPETLEKTTLKNQCKDQVVNLELPLRMSDRLGGHFVQGHVDGKAKVLSIETKGSTLWMQLEIDPAYSAYILDKGSIAIDGVSLTIAEKEKTRISIMLMNYTLDKTNLKDRKVGDEVNVEFDILAKMTHQMISKK